MAGHRDTKPWDDAQDALLTEMWKDGASSTEVGCRLGRSRNSIIGRVHRLGLSGRTKVAKREARKATRDRVEPRPTAQASGGPTQPRCDKPKVKKHEPVPPAPPRAGCKGLARATLFTATPDQCRFIIGDPSGLEDPPVCGAPVVDGQYCAEHAARCLTAARRKQPAARIDRNVRAAKPKDEDPEALDGQLGWPGALSNSQKVA